jgi:selenocysteine lyase/cysteine desulfurase
MTDPLEKLVAREFPVVERLVYLNHAAVAPWPWRTAMAVARFAEECAHEGARHYPRWLETERELKRWLAELLGAQSADEIALLKNTSEALSVVAYGFPWQAGDNVVISDEEFPSNRIVWESLKERGVAVKKVSLRGPDPEATLLAAADGRTRLLSVSSVQYASGRRLELARLGEGCRRRGIAFCVDAIQGLGAIHHDVEAMQIDFLMADAHKWLLGPEGIAVFYCRPAWRERLRLYEYGWHMVEDAGDYERADWEIAHTARRFECGSPNMLGVHALHASVSLLREVGMGEIERRVLARSEQIIDRIRAYAATLELLTPDRPGRYAGIVTFRHRRRDPQALLAALQQAGVVCAARGGGIRFSPHFYTPPAQLEQAVDLAAA